MIAAKAIKASATATFHSLSIERHRLSMQHLYQHGQCLEVGDIRHRAKFGSGNDDHVKQAVRLVTI